MRARPAETSAAVLSFHRPGHVLRLKIFDRFPHRRVAFVCAVAPVHRTLRSNRREYRGNATHLVTETHVKVPFVVDGEGLHASGDRMVWQLLIVRIPRGID